jgi:hypothetical protein
MRDNELEYYKNLDVSDAKEIKHPLIAELQKRHTFAQAKAFDVDVVEWVNTQDQETKRHINEMIRHLMAVKTTA